MAKDGKWLRGIRDTSSLRVQRDGTAYWEIFQSKLGAEAPAA